MCLTGDVFAVGNKQNNIVWYKIELCQPKITLVLTQANMNPHEKIQHAALNADVCLLLVCDNKM